MKATTRRPPASITILFVDDDAFFLRMLRRVMGDAGLSVLTATSGAEALATLAERRVDVVVSDIEMPAMSGLELLAAVRKKHPNTLRMLLSASLTLERAVQAVNEGEVHRIFMKPLDPEMFHETIMAFADRIARMRQEGEIESREARRKAFLAWVGERAKAALKIERNTRGEVVANLARVDKYMPPDPR